VFVSVCLFLCLFIVPIVLIVLCVCHQLGAASILSLVYCVVQIIVLIGLIVQMASNELLYCDPNAMFFLLVSGTFILCGILHPREILSLVCGIVYYLSIPTMYMILMIYAMCNLHVVSWGTREVKKSPAEIQREQMAAELKKAEEVTKSSKSGGTAGKLQSYFAGKHLAGAGDDGWKMQCGSCCKMVCCLPETSSTQKEVEYKLIVEKMNSVEKTMSELGQRLYDRLDDLDDMYDDYSDDFDDEEDSESAESAEGVEVGDEGHVGIDADGVSQRSDGVDEQGSGPVEQVIVPQNNPRKSTRVSFRFPRQSGMVVESTDVQGCQIGFICSNTISVIIYFVEFCLCVRLRLVEINKT